jgi:hypothetical protein
MVYNFRSSFLLSVIAVLSGVSNAVPSDNSKGLNNASYTPLVFGVGTTPIINGLQPFSSSNVTLNPSAPVLTLDYGAEVAGFPYFEVTSLGGPAAQIEIKYSEQFAGLNLSTGDGPWYIKCCRLECLHD